MSIDCVIANLDRREFVGPGDMGLNNRIQAIETVPSLFHVAMARLLVDRWAGGRVAIVCETAHSDAFKRGIPSWESLWSRSGWTNILPDVVEDLIVHRGPALDDLYNGKVRDLVQVLEHHGNDLESTIRELSDDAEQFGHSVGTEKAALGRELEHASEVLRRVKKTIKQRKKAARST